MAGHFLNMFKQERGRPHLRLSKEALESMLAYEWPGNIREMKNAIERAVVMGNSAEIQPEDLPAFTQKAQGAGTPGGSSLKEATDRFKREFVASRLRQSDGNRSRAAKSMKIQRTYLSRLIAKYGLQHL